MGRCIVQRRHEWDPGRAWLDNAVDEHTARPFRAILSRDNPKSSVSVLPISEIDGTLDYDDLPENDVRRAWRGVRSKVIKRDPVEMAETLKPVLTHCRRVLFVDAHFGPENQRHRNPFEQFLRIIASRATSASSVDIEWHTGDKATAAFFRSESKRSLAGLIPPGFSVRFLRWSQAKLHNRYVLTDIGGFQFGDGLDANLGNSRAEDVVSILDRDVCLELLKQYDPVDDDSTLTFVDEFTLQGPSESPGKP